MSAKDVYEANERLLAENEYPGRGIVQGLSPDGESAIQVYWLEGRSNNSRNRILEENRGTVSTGFFEEDPNADPSLVIYNAMRSVGTRHFVSNGHQTDSIASYAGRSDIYIAQRRFVDCLDTWKYEPDVPNFTPRISGMIAVEASGVTVCMSIIRRDEDGNARQTQATYNDNGSKGLEGRGDCIHTYDGDGNPIPAFSALHYPVSLENTAQENAEKYAEILDGPNFVSLVARAIPLDGSDPAFHIINKNQ